MGNAPYVTISTDQVHGKTQQIVGALIGRVGAVNGIVGYGKANPGSAKPEHYAERPHAPYIQKAGEQQRIRSEIKAEQDDGFEHHAVIPVFGEMMVLKILMNPVF